MAINESQKVDWLWKKLGYGVAKTDINGVKAATNESIAIDTEATGLQIPERDKLSLIQLCAENGDVYIVQPNRKTYKAPNLVSVLEKIEISL